MSSSWWLKSIKRCLLSKKCTLKSIVRDWQTRQWQSVGWKSIWSKLRMRRHWNVKNSMPGDRPSRNSCSKCRANSMRPRMRSRPPIASWKVPKCGPRTCSSSWTKLVRILQSRSQSCNRNYLPVDKSRTAKSTNSKPRCKNWSSSRTAKWTSWTMESNRRTEKSNSINNRPRSSKTHSIIGWPRHR